jgi:Chaperone of endosialidase
MKNLFQTLLLALGAFVFSGAHAQIPTSNDTSDGSENTGMGGNALGGATTSNVGFSNTASGFNALGSNTTGHENTALGVEALYYNTSGDNNTAVGVDVLASNKAGSDNTASGFFTLFKNGSGAGNTASGFEALYHNTDGRYNIAEGYKAGYNLTTGSYNIDIGNEGLADEGGIIRIGATQTSTYVAGITGVAPTPIGTVAPVYVNGNGQLGVGPPSSERFKTAIAPMGDSTEKLGELRPVTFQYKSDPHGARQYGLIAEEVAKVYPELVIRDAKGQILTVHYDELAPMLLNELQKEQTRNSAQDSKMRELEQQVAEMRTALLNLQAK